MRGLHCVLSALLTRSGRYHVIDYLDYGADFGDGTMQSCVECARTADQMIVVLGRDPGQTVGNEEVIRELDRQLIEGDRELDRQLIEGDKVPFTQLEVAAFKQSSHESSARGKQRRLYVLARAELSTGVSAESNNDERSLRLSLARRFLAYLLPLATGVIDLGPDFRDTVWKLNKRLSLGLRSVCMKYQAKQQYQDAVYTALHQSQGGRTEYLSIVGHWSMLTQAQMAILGNLDFSEMAMIGPVPTPWTLPGLLQRICVNEWRRQHKPALPAISLLAFPGDPPVRFATVGDKAFIQSAGPAEHLSRHAVVTDSSAKSLRDAFHATARYCTSAYDVCMSLLQQISDTRLRQSLDRIWESPDTALLRTLHRYILTLCAEECRKKDELIDPNLYELIEEHIIDVGKYWRCKSASARVAKETAPRPAALSCAGPDLRYVMSSVCPFRCGYCPAGNEDFSARAEPPVHDPAVVLPLIAAAAERCGIAHLALTGGEPTLIAGWERGLATAVKQTSLLTFQLQTAGSGLGAQDGRAALCSAAPRLRVKLSLDPGHAQTKTVAMDAIDALLHDGFPSDRIAVNYVCDRAGVAELSDFLKWLRDRRVAAKLLDLVWYRDIGNRVGVPQPHAYFSDRYVPMRVVRDLLTPAGYAQVALLDKHFGVTEEVFRDAGGHILRLRDSARGTTYGGRCVSCELYADAMCQEGIYQLEITSDYRLKVCRHRADLSRDIGEAIGADLASRTSSHTEAALREYVCEFYADSRREVRFSRPK